jgi:hypothetical protein
VKRLTAYEPNVPEESIRNKVALGPIASPHARAVAEEQVSVKIKPLEWVDAPDELSKATCVIGTYTIWDHYCHVELNVWDGGSFNVSLGRIQLAPEASQDDLKAAAQAHFNAAIRSALVTPPPSQDRDGLETDELWALCYLHDWDPPKEGQEHKWEPGKNVFPEIHAFYRTWQDAEAVRQDMMYSKDKYWVVRARPENETRLAKARLRLRPTLDDLMKGLREILAKANDGSSHGLSADFLCEEIADIARALTSNKEV